ncbi:CapA family protein [Mesorhizobium sangaii]|uniref:CapA family protein n=1 Tax=Mesorhizobium sangaii TaxID=505389 RepID=UPI003CCE3F45
MSYASNHTLNWGLEGVREACRVLDQNGIVYAGVPRTWHRWAPPAFSRATRSRGIAVVALLKPYMEREIDYADHRDRVYRVSSRTSRRDAGACGSGRMGQPQG